MSRRHLSKLSKSQRDKDTGKLYRICQKLERQINEEYEAEKAIIPIKIESESENEQEVAISTTASDALLTGLKMTCSDSEDSFDASAGAISPIWSVLSLLEVPNVSSAKESPATVMDMFSSVLEHVNEVQKTAELTRKEMERISDRLGRVEKKVGIFLAALDDVKDGIAMKEKISAYEASILSVCTKRISNEEEFTEFDSKLGSDEEYYSNVKNWLKMQIYEINPKSRMSKALDLLMERAFFTQCSWNGTSTMQESKVAFRKRTNVLKLFKDIGCNKLVTLNDTIVEKFFRKKLEKAKYWAKKKGLLTQYATERKGTGEPNEAN